MASSSRSVMAETSINTCPLNYVHSSPSSPASAALPSPPDSPSLGPYVDADLDSLSSFPSVSSSVFFSSIAGSPHSHAVSSSGHDVSGHGQSPGLIIPSLTLPSALPHPTPYGQTLGDLSLLFVGPTGGGKTALAEFLVDADDVVDVGHWEDMVGPGRRARVLHASTDWIEEADPHGLERFEGSSNVRLIELESFSSSDDPGGVTDTILQHVYGAFADIAQQVDGCSSSPLLHALLSSASTSLYTALLYVTATPLTQHDISIIARLSHTLPIIPICTTSLSLSPPQHIKSHLARFSPNSSFALRTGLFRSPHSVTSLRTDATDRFLRWKEAERVMNEQRTPSSIELGRRMTVTQMSSQTAPTTAWNKAVWETMLSEDVSRRLREQRKASSDDLTSSTQSAPWSPTGAAAASSRLLFPGISPTFDPLHLRSLLFLSLTLLTPRTSLFPSCYSSSSQPPGKEAGAETKESIDTLSTIRPSHSGSREPRRDRWRWRLLSAFMGVTVFCAGLGIGLVLSS